jgi:hypothetical protein
MLEICGGKPLRFHEETKLKIRDCCINREKTTNKLVLLTIIAALSDLPSKFDNKT